jgi:putative DNA primase/helicase
MNITGTDDAEQIVAAVLASWPEDVRPTKQHLVDESIVRVLHAWHNELNAAAADAAEPPSPSLPEPPQVQPQPRESDAVEAGDIASATRFVAMHHKSARYCAIYARWYCWDGTRWLPGIKGGIDVVLPLAEATAKAIAAEHIAAAADLSEQARTAWDEAEQQRGDDDRKAAKDRAKGLWAAARKHTTAAEKIQTEAKLKAMLGLARARPEMVVRPQDLDRHEYLLNGPNGTIDLRDGRIYPHNRDHFCTKMVGAEIAVGVTDRVLDAVLAHVCQTPAVAQYAQDVLGASCFGNNRFEKIYFWQGPGRSGKGTLMEAVKAALGDYATTAEFTSFVKTQGRNVRDDLDRLKESRLTLASEVERGEQLAAAVLKQFSGGDTVASRQLYGDYNEFVPRTTLHLQMNDLPRVDDQDTGIWERFVLIPCGPTISEDKRDPAIKEHLRDPKRGVRAVLSWLIAGAIRTHSLQRIQPPAEVVAASAQYRTSQNPIAGFVLHTLRFSPRDKLAETFVRIDDFNKAYSNWAASELIAPRLQMGSRELAKRIEKLGGAKGYKYINGKSQYVWFGLTLSEMDHNLRSYTYKPSDDEHLDTISSLDQSLANIRKSENQACSGNPIRARARIPACADPSQNTSDSLMF